MRCLGLDFGTVWTKACIHDTDTWDFEIVPFDSNPGEQADYELMGGAYSLPSAVFLENGRPSRVGKEAARSRFIDPLSFHECFKPQLANPGDTLSPILAEAVIRYAYERALALNDGVPFDKVTVTLPASTIENDTRWERMSKIMHDLGISDFSFIKEPEAAGYFILSRAIKENVVVEGERFLVYDFGGGTFDPALLEVRGGTLRVLGEWDFNGGRDLGGIHIDSKIRRDVLEQVDFLQDEVVDFLASIPQDTDGRPVIDTHDKQFMRDYRNALHYRDQLVQVPIAAKHHLSNTQASDYICRTDTYEYRLERERFNDIVDPVVDETLSCCDDLVSKYGGWQSINKIILVGGSSLIPRIKEKWQEKMEQDGFHYEILSAPGDGAFQSTIHAVSIGASMYESLQPSSDDRIRFGKDALRNHNYAEAEYQFDRARSLYWKCIMLHEGYGGPVNYRKIHEICNSHLSLIADPDVYSKDDMSLLFLHLYMLLNGEGMRKDDKKILEEFPDIVAFDFRILRDLVSLHGITIKSDSEIDTLDTLKLPFVTLPIPLPHSLIYKYGLIKKAAQGEACIREIEIIHSPSFYFV